MNEIDIGFAGRYAANHSIHQMIAAPQAGDALQLQKNEFCWDTLDEQGSQLGQLAKSFVPPAGMSLVSAYLIAVTVRCREDSPKEY